MYSRKKYPYYDGKFKNNIKETVKASLFKTIICYLKTLKKIFKKKEKFEIKTFFYELDFKKIIESSFINPIIIPMGHATNLIFYKGLSIITDPIFFSPSIFLKRYIDFIDLKKLPKIDYILISHDHPDHLDIKSLKILKNNNSEIKCIVPLRLKKLILKAGIKNIYELTWWQDLFIDRKNKIKFTCLPAKHWSLHGLFNKNYSLWCSWMISLDDKNLYFAGDTAYGEHFSDIFQEFKKIDLAFLPIAPYNPKNMNSDSHLDPKDSYRAFLDLGEPFFVPIHWGVFDYGMESRIDPINKIRKIMQDNNMMNKLVSDNIGKEFKLNDFYLSNTIKKDIYV